MRIRVLLFAQYRDLAGTDELTVELPDGATASDLVARVRADTRMAVLPLQPALAVNCTYAPISTALADGDEVALLPPVAGG